MVETRDQTNLPILHIRPGAEGGFTVMTTDFTGRLESTNLFAGSLTDCLGFIQRKLGPPIVDVDTREVPGDPHWIRFNGQVEIPPILNLTDDLEVRYDRGRTMRGPAAHSDFRWRDVEAWRIWPRTGKVDVVEIRR